MDCKKFDIEDYKILQQIGEGAVSKVYLVEEIQTKKQFALKKIEKQIIQQQNILYQIYLEKLFTVKLQSKYVLKLFGTTQDEDCLYFLLEYTKYGSLNDLMQSEENLPIEIVQYVMSQILDILQFFRKHGIIHRDLKPSNILISDKYELKIIDLGTAKVIKNNTNKLLYDNYCSIKEQYKKNQEQNYHNDQQYCTGLPSFVGTANYVAPEILNESEPSFGTDLWSFAVILYRMLTKKFPFKGANSFSIFKQIQRGQIHYSEQMDKNAKKILKKIFVKDQFKRLGNGTQEEELDFLTLKNDIFFFNSKKNRSKFLNLPFFNQQKKEDNRSTENNEFYQNKRQVVAKGLVKKYKYWFFYDTRQIQLYADKKLEYINPYTNTKKGEIDLQESQIEKINSKDFILKTKNRAYYFRVVNEQSDFWVSIILKVCNQFIMNKIRQQYQQKSLEEKKELSNRLLQKNPECIPVVLFPDDERIVEQLKQYEFLINKDKKLQHLIVKLRKSISLPADEVINILSGSNVLNVSQYFADLYEKYKDDDGFLYLVIKGIPASGQNPGSNQFFGYKML